MIPLTFTPIFPILPMYNDIRWLAPLPPDLLEALVAYHLTREFYREVEQRERFHQYCQWYYETAAQCQREAGRMQRDINLLGWFYRRDRRR